MSTELASLHRRLAGRPGDLEPLLCLVRRIEAVQQACRAWSDEPWMEAIRVVNLRGNTLVMHADNAAALTALRYRREQLLGYLREHHQLPLTRLEVRVRPQHPKGGV